MRTRMAAGDSVAFYAGDADRGINQAVAHSDNVEEKTFSHC